MTLQSESIATLTAALVEAQKRIEGARKTAENSHLKSHYATLADVWEACRAPLAENGFAVTSALELAECGLMLRTTLRHASGEWLASEFPILAPLDKPQAIGSAISYGRRYALSALVGVCSVEDDDGEAAMPAKGGGKAEKGGRGDNSRKEVNRQFPAKGAPARANGKSMGKPVAWGDWLSGAVRQWSGFEPIESTEDRQEREWRVINDLVTRGIADGLLDPEKVAKTNREGKRVRSRSLSVEAARWLVETQPDWCRLALDDHLADLRSRAAAEGAPS